MNKKSKWIALLLAFSLVLTMLPVTSKAADSIGKISAWFSNDATGGLYLYAHPSQTVTLNYAYSGDFSSYKVKVTVTDEGGSVILSEVNTNTPKNQILVEMPSEEGTYTASVDVSSGTSSIKDRAEISVVKDLPTIIQQPQSVTTDIQKNVNFSVLADEGATYQWYRTKAIDEEGEEISGAAASTLTVTAQNVVASTNGDYFYCMVTAKGKSIMSSYARLVINGVALPTESPRVSSKPTETASPTDSPDVSDAPTAEPTKNPATNLPLPTENPKQNEVVENGIWTLVDKLVKANGTYSGVLKDGTDRTVVENKTLEKDFTRTIVFETIDGKTQLFGRRPESEDIGTKIWVTNKKDYITIYNPVIPTSTPKATSLPRKTSTPTKAPAKVTTTPTAEPQNTPEAETIISPMIRYNNFSISGKYNGSKNRVEFQWKVPNEAVTSSLEIYRSEKKDGVYQLLGTPTSTSYNDSKVLPNKTYYYRVSYLMNEENYYTYYMSNICSIKTVPNPTVKDFKAKKKGRKLTLSWKYGMYANRVAVYVKTGKKWTKAGTTLKTTCKMTIPYGYKKVKARIRPYNVIKGKKYYGRYSKTLTVKFKKR